MKFVIALIIKIQVFSLIVADSSNFNLNDSQVAAKRSQEARSTCLLPPVTPDKSYIVTFPHKENASQPEPGEIVEQFTVIVSRCNDGYAVNYQTDASNESPSICMNNSWQPPIPTCKRTCKNFSQFSNYNMSCYEYFGGQKVPCNGLLLESAILIPRCQQKFHHSIKVNYDYATCREDGTWDKPFFKCVPDCGKISSSSVSLIPDGHPEKRGGAPWNVAIYSTEFDSKTPRFICGGTLISAELVTSAAHCFYNEESHQISDTSYFHVVVGKATLDYTKQDYDTTKTYTLKKIFLPETTYKGAETNYASDIAILQLSEKVYFSWDVLPACLHWDTKDRFNPGDNVMGKLSGFGVAENGPLKLILRSVQLPFISYNECLKNVRENFSGSISLDKFCAGSKTDTRVQSGDSGAGLVFMDKATGLFHLGGVVSNKDLNSSSIATFTDITKYTSWIAKMVETTERNSECDCNLAGIKQGACNTKSGSCQCKAFVTGLICDTCKDGFWNFKANNPDGCLACGCSSVGSFSSVCNKITGSCQCKPNVIGRQCDKCADSTQVLTSNGCEDGPVWLKFAHGDRCTNAIAGGIRTPTNETLFIARHQINENLSPGKLVPSQKSAYIPLSYGEHSFSDYEVLCGGSVEWVAARDGVIPRGAIAGGLGYGDIGPEIMYVCRALAEDGSVIPGKLHPSRKLCFIPNGGTEHSLSIYEVLVKRNARVPGCECNSIGTISPFCEGANITCKCKPNVIGKNCDRCAPNTYNFGEHGCNEDLKWLKYTHGEKCPNAVIGGVTPTNEILYIARHEFKGDLIPGKLVPSQKLVFLSWNYEQYPYADYEVLCGGSTKWVAGSNGVVPERAVAGGIDGRVKETMYICKVKLDDGSVIPGKQVPRLKVCFFAHEGKEYYSTNYEVLVKHGNTGCECNSVGTIFPFCERANTSCKCKLNVIGKNCDKCAPNTYNFSQQGCKEFPKWLSYSNGEKCPNAVVGGQALTNETLYIARHEFNGDLIPGKLVPSQKMVFIPWNSEQYPFSDYEVLCGGSTKWVATSNDVVPEGAVPVGMGGEVKEIIYICRVKLSDGSVVPGKLQARLKRCYFAQDGREYFLTSYEVLILN